MTSPDWFPNKIFVVLMGFVLLFVLFTPPFPSPPPPSSSSSSSLQQQQQQPEEEEVIPSTNSPSSLFTTTPTTAVVDSMLPLLTSELHALRQYIQKLESNLDLHTERLKKLESAMYLDGSLALHAMQADVLATSRIKPCEWPKCQFHTTFADSLQGLIRFKQLSRNNSLVMDLSEKAVLSDYFETYLNRTEDVKDKSVDLILFPPEDGTHNVYLLLTQYVRKLKVGGVAIGSDYSVVVPFSSSSSSLLELSTTVHDVDAYRLGKDNDLGQGNHVWVAGPSLWYFTKSKTSLFGRQ